jgi:hypothetical protein
MKYTSIRSITSSWFGSGILLYCRPSSSPINLAKATASATETLSSPLTSRYPAFTATTAPSSSYAKSLASSKT